MDKAAAPVDEEGKGVKDRRMVDHHDLGAGRQGLLLPEFEIEEVVEVGPQDPLEEAVIERIVDLHVVGFPRFYRSISDVNGNL
jgi:hypothetical protein